MMAAVPPAAKSLAYVETIYVLTPILLTNTILLSPISGGLINTAFQVILSASTSLHLFQLLTCIPSSSTSDRFWLWSRRLLGRYHCGL